MEADWKLKLKYGLLKTPYKHCTLLAEGLAEESITDFDCPKGPAFMGIKIWAEEADMVEIIQGIAQQIGFTITGRIQIWETDPKEPPGEDPYGYDINFTPFVDE